MSIQRLTTWKKKVAKLIVAAGIIGLANGANSVVAQGDPKPPQWMIDAVNNGDRCKQFESKMKDYGLPVKWFTYIAYRESRCRVGAVNAKWKDGKIVWTLNKNGTFDSGLFQINSGWRTLTKNTCGGGLDKLLTVDCNMKMAKYLYENGGLRHWGFRY